MSVYAIRELCTAEFYAYTKVTPSDRCMVRIVYFRKKRDAERFTRFLNNTDLKNPKLHEYEECYFDNSHMKKKYVIHSLPDEYFRFTLGLSGLGYHLCDIEDKIVTCVETDTLNVPPMIRADIFEETYNKIDIM